jgi:hypothetical protein
MNITESEIKVIEADNFSIETKYRMVIEYCGQTYYWHGFIGEYGLHEDWYGSDEKRTGRPDWADDLELFDLCEEKSKENEKSFDWLVTKILQIVPTATFERDENGQILIFTGLEEDETGTVRKVEGEVK